MGSDSMMALLCLLAVFSVNGQSPYCTQYTGTPSPNDPPLPDLPDQFQTVVEANFVDKGYTITAYEYFDSPGNQAAVRARKNNTDQISLFDYTNDKVFYITGTNCTTKNLTKDKTADVLFGNLSKDGIPHILSTQGALHILKRSSQKYLGVDNVRGIRVDHWQSCVYWPLLRANFTLDYYFTVKNWQDPIGYPRNPVRAYVKGLMQDLSGTISNVEHYYDYIDFTTEIDDLTVFEPPVYVVCEGRNSLPVPHIKNFFHAKLETYLPLTNHVWETDLWYDSVTRIARYDTKHKHYTALKNPVSIIYDYNYGIKYTKDKVSGACNVQSIQADDLTASLNPNSTQDFLWYVISMKSAQELFDWNINFTYIGRRTVRGIMCNAFSGIWSHGNKKYIYEYYTLAEGYTEYPDDVPDISESVPVQVIFRNEQQFGVEEIATITSFSEVPPDIGLFDISECYSENSSVSFTVRFQGTYASGLRDEIIRQSHNKMAAVMNVSPLRIQNVYFNYDNSFVYISAKMLDISPLLEQFTMVANITSTSLNDLSYPASVVSSPYQCAQYCLFNKNFTCKSFDFCADHTPVCRLSRTHTVGKAGQTQGVSCTHYSRTIDDRNQVEVTTASAYQKLVASVYNGQIQIQTFLPYMTTPIFFQAVDLSLAYGRLYYKGVPQFTGQFSYHLEYKLPSGKTVFNTHIWYDYEYQIVRYDMLDNGPVSKIHDYNSGVSYIINRNTLECKLSPITNNSFDVQSPATSQNGYVLKLKNPIQLFDLSNNFIYTGQKSVRGILADSYENVGQFDFGNGLKPAILQFYFMARKWNELSESSGQTVNTQPIGLVATATDSSATIIYDIIDFNEQHPDLTNFNIQPCFPSNKQRDFIIVFNQTYHPTLDKRLALFTKTVQKQLSILTGVSPLRFQSPQITYDGPRTFYTATMVEQSPSLLDFTKISGTVGVYSSDATYVDIASDAKCADICSNIKGFTCLSFDYCPTTKNCQLSKRHTPDGRLLKKNTTCDHYSKTVDTISSHEPTINDAIKMLQNKVALGDFKVNIQNDSNKTITYQATIISGNITRYDDGKANSETLSHYDRTEKRAIHIRNAPSAIWIRYSPVSVDDCATKCLTHASFECESFSYCANIGGCFISGLHPAENASSFEDSPVCDLYSRKYTDRYTVYGGTTTIHGSRKTIASVGTANICAKYCSRSSQFTCKSFDFCMNTKTCYLSDDRSLNVSSSTIVQAESSVCLHYGRKYLFDFTKTANSDIARGQSVTVTNVTVENCAKLCVDTYESSCKSFVFCGHSTCNIFSIHPGTVEQAIGDSAVCDLYTRHISRSAYTQPVQGASKQSKTLVSGYGAGAMTAVAFGAFIPGLVFGAAILYFTKTKKLVERKHEHEMNIVENEHFNTESS